MATAFLLISISSARQDTPLSRNGHQRPEAADIADTGGRRAAFRRADHFRMPSSLLRRAPLSAEKERAR